MTLIAVHRVLGVFYGHTLGNLFHRLSVPLLLLLCFLFSFGLLHLPLAGAWGQMGYRPQVPPAPP